MARKNNEKYSKEFCEKLIAHMSKGHSFTSFAAEINVTRQTLHNWANSFPEFSEAKDIGESKAKLFLEKALFSKVGGIELSTDIDMKNSEISAIIFALKTRFHKEYGDKVKQEVQITDFNFVGDDDE